jgi:hypothetical protein
LATLKEEERPRDIGVAYSQFKDTLSSIDYLC